MDENSFADLQTEVMDYIFGRDQRVLAKIEDTTELSAERRLAIYHNAYRARLIDVLADTYARVVAYIGEEPFDEAARAYIEQHASVTRNLREYGRKLPQFLKAYYPRDPEVAELAEMDARLRYTFDGTDADVLTVDDVAPWSPEQWDVALLTLHPTVSFQRFEWNTPTIWQCLSSDNAPPAAVLLPQPSIWLFWRKALLPHFRSLSPEEHTALWAIHGGVRFSEICEMLAESWPELDVTAHVGGWLRTWLEDGVLARLNQTSAADPTTELAHRACE